MKKTNTTNTRKKRAKTAASKAYWKMTTAELRAATKEFDQECIGDTFRPATPEEQARFERARKRGRPRSARDRRRSASRWRLVYWPKPTGLPRSFVFPGPC